MSENASETSPVQVEGENASAEVSYETLVAQGKRNLMCKEFPQAVNQLQEAARLVAKKFGETAKECASVYLCYGTGLLELARAENLVLGNALTGIPESAEEEEGENVVENTFVEPDETTKKKKVPTATLR